MFSVTANLVLSHALLNGKCSFPVKIPQFQKHFTWIICYLCYCFFSLGRRTCLRSKFHAAQIITSSIIVLIDVFCLPKGCHFCFSGQIHILICTSVLNLTPVRMLPKGCSQVFLKEFLCVRTSYFMCGGKNEMRWKVAMQNCSISQSQF